MTPGFADPVFDAQAVFRILMDAMARPGRVASVQAPGEPPAGLHRAAAATLLTLADADTPLWTDAGDRAREWLAFHTGARFTADPVEADILLATGPAPPLGVIRTGSDEMPQDGATLVLQASALDAGTGWRLTGPGIQAEHRLCVQSLPEGFVPCWRRNRSCFPRGFDLILTAGDRLAALPRTTRIEEAA